MSPASRTDITRAAGGTQVGINERHDKPPEDTMKFMGKHSPPVDGVPVANGHSVLAPFAIPAPLQTLPQGPVSGWPQRQDAAIEPARKADRWRHARRVMAAHRGWLAAIPIVLVNSVAFAGQLSFLRHHLPWPLAGQALVAVTLESVAVYLAWQAHLALAADDSALRLRLAAYSFAAVIGTMNFSHYAAPHWHPTFAAITFGLMSLSSPWLWSVHSRRSSRDALKAAGLIEPHAVRLGMTRWLWHPWRSVRVMSSATWAGETDPAKAIATWRPAKATLKLPSGDGTDPPPDEFGDDPEDDMDVPPDPPPPPPDDETLPLPPPPNPPNPRPRKPSGRAKAVAILKRNPGLSDADVAKRAGVSERTVQRARSELAAPK